MISYRRMAPLKRILVEYGLVVTIRDRPRRARRVRVSSGSRSVEIHVSPNGDLRVVK